MTGRWTNGSDTYLAFCGDGRGLLAVAGEERQEFRWRALSDKALQVIWAEDREELLPFRMTDNGLHIAMGSHTDSETPLRYAGKPGALEEERELGSASG